MSHGSAFERGRDLYIITHSDDIRTYVSNTPATRLQITCFRCGEQGHYKSECYSWKTRMCWNYLNSTTAQCNEVACSFAHGYNELRTPYLPRCVRVVKKDGVMITCGCRKFGHTYKCCPYK